MRVRNYKVERVLQTATPPDKARGVVLHRRQVGYLAILNVLRG